MNSRIFIHCSSFFLKLKFTNVFVSTKIVTLSKAISLSVLLSVSLFRSVSPCLSVSFPLQFTESEIFFQVMRKYCHRLPKANHNKGMKAQPYLVFLFLTEHLYVGGLELFPKLHFPLDCFNLFQASVPYL